MGKYVCKKACFVGDRYYAVGFEVDESVAEERLGASIKHFELNGVVTPKAPVDEPISRHDVKPVEAHEFFTSSKASGKGSK